MQYLIPTYNLLVLVLHSNMTPKIFSSIGRFNAICCLFDMGAYRYFFGSPCTDLEASVEFGCNGLVGSDIDTVRKTEHSQVAEAANRVQKT